MVVFSSKCPSDMIYIHIGCIWVAFLQKCVSKVFSSWLHEWMQNYMITFVWRALGKPPTQPARPPPSQWHPSPPRQPFLSYHHQHHRHQLRHFTLLLVYLHDLNVVFTETGYSNVLDLNDAFVSYLVLLVVGQLQVSLLDKQCLSATIPPNSITL